jgi:hypothetical protein
VSVGQVPTRHVRAYETGAPGDEDVHNVPFLNGSGDDSETRA